MTRKVKVRLKITGLELEFEGTQEDVPQIGQNLARNIAGLITAGPNLANPQIGSPAINGQENPTARSGGKRTASKARKPSKDEKQSETWNYDGQLYGRPSQNWSGNDKAIWILYVGDKVMGFKQMGSAQITNTFNEHYQEAKRIHRGNVYSGLDGLRSGDDAPVGKSNDGSFFLTQAGQKWAERLIETVSKSEVVA